MKWMSSRGLLCLTVKLQSSFKRIYFLIRKREGVKIISQTENVVKEITVHIISVLKLLFLKLPVQAGFGVKWLMRI